MSKAFAALSRDLKKNWIKWLMLLPAVTVVILMCYIPMAGILLAFKEFNYHDGIFGSPWVGLDNFTYFFQSGKAWSVTRNTILYNLAFLLVNNLCQVCCSIFLSEIRSKWFKRVSQSLMFMPYFISWVVVGAFVYNLLNYEFGAVNTLLRQFQLNPIDVYSNKHAWIPILILASLFKNLGYGTVMYLASVINIDGQLYEAADLDGASMWQKIWHITLPGMPKPDITGYLSSMTLAGRMLDRKLIGRREFVSFEEKMRVRYGLEKGSIYRDHRLLCVPDRANITHCQEVIPWKNK